MNSYASEAGGTWSPPNVKKSVGYGKHDNMFPTPQWRDLWAAVLFYLHFVFFIGLSVYAIVKAKDLPVREGPGGGIDLDRDLLSYLGVSFLGAAGTAVGLTILTILFMQSSPEPMLHAAFISNIVLLAGIAIWAFIGGGIVPGIIMSLMAIISLIFYVVFKKRIPFSAIILRTVIDCLKAYPNMLIVTSGSVVFSLIYMGFFTSAIGALGLLHDQAHDNNATWMTIYAVFSFFWTSQVITNTTQATIAGVYATYYFLHGTGQTIVNPVAQSFKRATTYSFGSICFGSLIVAVIQTIRFLLQTVRDDDSIAGVIVDCILGMIQGLVEYFNYYAYTQIAIYGKPYIQAAKDTWNLVKSRGVDAIVNDNLIGTCLGITSLTIGVASGLVVYLLSSIVYGKEWELSLVASVVLGIIAIIIPSVAFEIIGAGATATFVCLAEDPQALQRSKPELYNAIMEKYSLINF